MRIPSTSPASALSASGAARRQLSGEAAIEDGELIRRFLSGDESAFPPIVARHRDKLFGVAIGVLHNPSDAEEIVQDTFIRAYRGLKRFRGESSLATWLHHVTANLARNRYWYFHRRKQHVTLSLACPLGEDGMGTIADFISSPEAGPQRERMHTEFVELVTACMEQLLPGQREILSLRNQFNRSYEQIARALGIQVGTVKSRIARARGKLRSLMVEACPEFAADGAPPGWFERADTRLERGRPSRL